jgi:drug/metabolite transporter (DMT)-like permease
VHALAIALSSAILFGASTPCSKLLLVRLEPFQLAGLLYLGAALGMAPVAALELRRGMRASIDGVNLARIGGVVLSGGVLGPVLLLAALRVTAASSVSLILNLEAVATALLGVLMFHEHLGGPGWLGVAGSIVASGIVAGFGGWPGSVGGGLAATACLCWGVDNQLTAAIDRITPAQSTLVKGIIAGATNLTIGVARAPLDASPAVVAGALGVGALSYGVSIMLHVRAAHELGATRAQGVFASAPFAGAAIAFAFLGEPIRAAHVAALLLLVPSVAALFWSRHAHLHAHAATEHTHSHRHDDGHHFHEHPGHPPATRHSHRHRHGPLEHAHPHWPDLHHRHPHSR